MNLHENAKLFRDTITETAMFLNIEEIFIEKDYWLTYALQRMSRNPNTEKVVFKGGTSLSKGYQITSRFSEDIDIAVIDADSMTGNQLKMLIKRLAKDISVGLEEKIIPKVTSKGSRFYKAIYTYPSVVTKQVKTAVKSGELLIEINTYGNPYPFVKQEITSFITEFFLAEKRSDFLEKYDMQKFLLNVLDKRRTMLEKIVSLLRFSFDENAKTELSKKIRHFYDLYYLAKNTECAEYIQSDEFFSDLQEVFTHDQTEFDIPQGWTKKQISDSPLLTEFLMFWNTLKITYKDELSNLAFMQIPDERLIEESLMKIIKRIRQ
jgi:predicted nucleotidyltransferase component of viral defense system